MIDLENLQKELLLKNQNLKAQKEITLKKYKIIKLDNNILLSINDELIEYFKSIIGDLTLLEEEQKEIQFIFQFYEMIKSFNIDLTTLYYEDKNIIRFKENIKILINKISNLREFVCSNVDLEINNNNLLLNNISKLTNIYNDEETDLELVFDLLNELPLDNIKKINIYKLFFKKQIEQLKEKNKPKDIEFKITEDDKKLKLGVEILLKNLKKLKGKIQSVDYQQNIEDSIKFSELNNRVLELNNNINNYFNDKTTIWNAQEFSKDELEDEFNKQYQIFLQRLEQYTIIYNELFNKYGLVFDISLDEESGEINDEYPPIIYWFGNNNMVSEDNYEEIERIISDFDNYPEDNFYKDKLKPALELLKTQPHFVDLKQMGIENTKIETIRGVSNAIPFRELKLRPGKGGTARIYYDTIKTQLGKKFIVVYMITNKHDTYDKLNYQQVERYLKGPIFSKLSILLDNPEIIEEFRKVEQTLLDKIDKKISKEQKVGGSK